MPVAIAPCGPGRPQSTENAAEMASFRGPLKGHLEPSRESCRHRHESGLEARRGGMRKSGMGQTALKAGMVLVLALAAMPLDVAPAEAARFKFRFRSNAGAGAAEKAEEGATRTRPSFRFTIRSR